MHKQSAIATAHAEGLARATAELIRYAREGATSSTYPFGTDDIAAALVEALHFMLTTETAIPACDLTVAEPSHQLIAALEKWLADEGFDLPELIEADGATMFGCNQGMA